MDNSLIGLIDLDLLFTKELSQPNYELCAFATYLKQQKIGARLILDTSLKNLKRYNKIYIFKSHKYTPGPAQVIREYYKINAEEYGEGFLLRPLHPDIPELFYITPETEIYLPLVNFLEKNPGNRKYKLKNISWFYKYKLVKHFNVVDGEVLVRLPIPVQDKNVLIYDDPLLFFKTERGKAALRTLTETKIVQFATPLDISELSEESDYEILMREPRLATLRKNLYSSRQNHNMKKFFGWLEKNREKIKAARITVVLADHDDYRYYFFNALRITHALPLRLGKKVRVFPRLTAQIRKKHYLIRWFYSWQRAKIGSFYEYAIYRAYTKEIKAAKLTGKIDPYTVEYLFKNYGIKGQLTLLEELMYQNEEAEKLIMTGGKSYYGQERAKYSIVRGTESTSGRVHFQIRPDRIATKTVDFVNRRNRRTYKN
jgi:hypothetical protein